MKKVLSTLLIVLLCTALMLGVLSGCGKQAPQGGESTTTGSNNTTGNNTDGGNETPDDPAGGEQKLLTWEEYQELSDAEKDAYFKSFESVSAYNDWYFAAYDEFKKNEEKIVVGPNTVIDITDLMK